MPKLYFYTHSPISIGTGEKLSPYSDFILDENYVYFLNQARLKEAFQQSPAMDSLIDEYVAGVATGMDNNRSSFDLKNFLHNRLKIDFKAYSLRRVAKGVSVKGKIHIAEIIKNPHFQPYVPGSSLKGAFKGALLYKWLTENQEGKHWIDEICKKLNATKEEKRTIEQKLNEQYESYEIALSDSISLPVEAVKIYKIIRFHLKDTQQQGTPQYVEALMPNIKFEAEYRSEKISLQDALKALQKYSQDANARDIELLEQSEKTNEKLLKFYQDIAEKLNNGEYLFKIGSGKGYFFQAVGLSIYRQKGVDVFKKFIEVYRPSDKKINAEKFPLTKVIDADSQLPWGWVQVSEQIITKEEAVLEKWQKPIATQAEEVKEVEKVKKVVAQYLKAGTKLKQGLEIDAVVVKSGKPNQVKLMLSEGNEPVFTLRGYNSELSEGTILVCRIAQINKKGEILDVSFHKIKN